MTDKETYQQQMREECSVIFDQQKALVNELVELVKGSPNKAEVFPYIFATSFKIRMLEVQKQIIISRPFPKKEWAKGSPAIINETGRECINYLPITSPIFPKDCI